MDIYSRLYTMGTVSDLHGEVCMGSYVAWKPCMAASYVFLMMNYSYEFI